MATPYQGRHSGGGHPTPKGRRHGTSQKPHLFAHALRRPLASAAAVVAVAGVTAGGYASAAKPQASAASFTASPAAMAQAAELSQNGTDTNAALAQARRSGVQRASALTQQEKARAQAKAAELTRVREEAAAEAARAREESADRVAREHEREGLLERAQSDPQAAGRLLAADRGWEGEQFECLDSLWTKESGWRWDADNPTSDAYGIPQSLPGSKMASVGSDWETNPITQIKWGLEYISATYGTPCSAWSKSQASNWY